MRKTKQLISKILLLSLLLTNTAMPVQADTVGETLTQGETSTITENIPVEEEKPIEIELEEKKIDEEEVEKSSLTREKTYVAGDPVEVSVQLSPEDALLFLVDKEGHRVFKNGEGKYNLVVGETYSYQLTKPGYVGIKSSFEVTEDKVSLNLEKAKENTQLQKDISSAWPSFRGNKANNAVVDSLIPTNADDASLYWATKAGKDWSEAVGSPIIVNDELVFTVGTKLRKMNRFTGEFFPQIGTLAGAPNFNIIAPLYAEGMIFVGLANGTIQAFDAKTLESLWVYKDALKGQPNSPIFHHKGYVYTGFWNNEDKDANFVALSITDEDPSKVNEEKVATWTHTHKGGYYWSGAYITDNFLLIGTDDGDNRIAPTSKLLSLNPVTGEVIDEINALNGDIRSAITYDEKSEGYYFTSKGGSFYGVSVDPAGKFTKESNGLYYKEVKLGNNHVNFPSSTSTPVVNNGRAYVGVSGTSQFGAYSGHNITVIDLASFEIAYQAPTRGYPQTSGLLTQGYEDGYNYVYFVDNYTPGKIRVIKDKPGMTELMDPTTETEMKSVKNAAPVLFTPIKAQAQYAIASPIADEYGTMYFKNDSGHMMALGSKITKIEITKAPHKTLYGVGETIDLEGMKVMAHYANGLTRDVTKHVKASELEIETNEVDYAITYGISLYGDKYDQVNGNKAGVLVAPAEAIQDITVLSLLDINAVREVESAIVAIGDVTLSSAVLLDEARQGYEKLDEDLKSYIAEVSTLVEKEIDFNHLTEVFILIEALDETPLKNEEALKVARTKYDALDEKLQNEVKNKEKLFSMEEQFSKEKDEITHVEELIENIGMVTLDSGDLLIKAREAYDSLNELQKANIKNIERLKDGENTYTQLKSEVDSVNKLITILSGKGIEDKALIKTLLQSYENLSLRQKQDVVGYEKLQASALHLEEDEKRIMKVHEKILAIGEVTFTKESDIQEARELFHGLDDNLKVYVTNLSELMKAEDELIDMKQKVEMVTALIEGLKTDETKVTEAREAYNKLTEEEKNQIKNLQILISVEDKIKDQDKNEDKKPGVKPGIIGGSPQTGDPGISLWITLFILSLTFLGFMGMKDFKKRNESR